MPHLAVLERAAAAPAAAAVDDPHADPDADIAAAAPPADPCSDPNALWNRAHRPTRLRQLVDYVWGSTTGRDWPERHAMVLLFGAVFEHTPYPLFVVFDVLATVTESMLLGVLLGPRVPPEACKPVAVTVAVLIGAQLLAGVFLRPMLSRYDAATYVFFQAIGLLMAIIGVTAQYGHYSQDDARAAFDAINLTQGVAAIVVAAGSLLENIYEHCAADGRHV
jgi:hypothetical protein